MKRSIFRILLTVLIIGLPAAFYGQSTPGKRTFIIKKIKTVDPDTIRPGFAPQLVSLEAPSPGGNNYKSFLARQKQRSAQLFPANKKSTTGFQQGDAENPVVGKQMGMYRYIAPIDKELLLYGGTPLDNTMALGPGNKILASVNSFLWGYDLDGDTTIFNDADGSTKIISFTEFGEDYITGPNEFPFDPKLLYVIGSESGSRGYIFVFLSGRGPSDSKIIVGFTSSDNPADPWHVYMLPGNPRDTNQWTDFPMIGFDAYHFYVSINLIEEGVSWQDGFRGSIVWQIPLEEGFSGKDQLSVNMWDNIQYNGTNIRNLTPVQPAPGLIDNNMYFLSNRNFDLQNDSLFVLKFTSNGLSDSELKIDVKKLKTPYGVPPNGIQADDDPTDETDGLQTNDARWLGAVRYLDDNNKEVIEFVGNTKNFNSGRAAIYHGTMTDPAGGSDPVDGTIIGIDTLDFGYPNITYVNNGQGCYRGTIIAFNHTAFNVFAGVSAIFHSADLGYSDIIRIKEGENYVARIPTSYERWGDYFGMQTDWENPGRVFTAGFYGTSNRKSSTWFAELFSPDSVTMQFDFTYIFDDFNKCLVEMNGFASGGYPPYRFDWGSDDHSESAVINICDNHVNSVAAVDSRNCKISQLAFDEPFPIPERLIYPNPSTDRITITFRSSAKDEADFLIYDATGRLVYRLGKGTVTEGYNAFSFTTTRLRQGTYVLYIRGSGGNEIFKSSFVKL